MGFIEILMRYRSIPFWILFGFKTSLRRAGRVENWGLTKIGYEIFFCPSQATRRANFSPTVFLPYFPLLVDIPAASISCGFCRLWICKNYILRNPSTTSFCYESASLRFPPNFCFHCQPRQRCSDLWRAWRDEQNWSRKPSGTQWFKWSKKRTVTFRITISASFDLRKGQNLKKMNKLKKLSAMALASVASLETPECVSLRSCKKQTVTDKNAGFLKLCKFLNMPSRHCLPSEIWQSGTLGY